MKKNKDSKTPYIGLFIITSQCNDHCKFCIKSEFIKKQVPELTLEEIKKNYFFLKKSFNLHHIVLSGGEPTLHPQIFEILDFFEEEGVPTHLITNLLRFNEKKFLDKLLSYFYRGGPKRKNQIEGSINDLPGVSKNARLRMSGLEKVIKHQLPIEIITVIYRHNVEFLPKLVHFVKNLFQKHSSSNLSFSWISAWEFRSLYIPETPADMLEKFLPTGFSQLKEAVEKSINILNASPSIKTIIRRLPLCYFKNFSHLNAEVMKNRISHPNIWVDKDYQLEKAKVSSIKRFDVCLKCRLSDVCSGSCGEKYLKKCGYPFPRPIEH